MKNGLQVVELDSVSEIWYKLALIIWYGIVYACACSSVGLEQQPSKLWVARSIRAWDAI